MIAHRITLDKLETRIEAASKNWRKMTTDFLGTLPATPSSKDFVSHWSKIKAVYIDLQQSKCCFCELPLDGNAAQDVEHFRPKAEVTCWKIPKKLVGAGIKIVQPARAKVENGYRNVAYHPFNYAMACKHCNSSLKKNLFPVAGSRKSAGTDPRKMKTEKPLLIYPLGEHDVDPEDLITHQGITAVAVETTGHARDRGLVTIEMFNLDTPSRRKKLFEMKAYLTRLLYLELSAATPNQTAIKTLLASQSPFANCLRAFNALYRSDRAAAKAYADECTKLMASKSYIP